MTYRIKISVTAADDIAALTDYISADSYRAARRWYDGCIGAIGSLAELPTRRPLAPETVTFDREIRQLLYHSHRILFEVVADTVNVLHVRHASRATAAPDEIPTAPWCD